MDMQVRTDYSKGKLLFDWDPKDNTIGIVLKNMFYLIKLIPGGSRSSYRIIEKRPKNDPSPRKNE